METDEEYSQSGGCVHNNNLDDSIEMELDEGEQLMIESKVKDGTCLRLDGTNNLTDFYHGNNVNFLQSTNTSTNTSLEANESIMLDKIDADEVKTSKSEVEFDSQQNTSARLSFSPSLPNMMTSDLVQGDKNASCDASVLSRKSPTMLAFPAKQQTIINTNGTSAFRPASSWDEHDSHKRSIDTSTYSSCGLNEHDPSLLNSNNKKKRGTPLRSGSAMRPIARHPNTVKKGKRTPASAKRHRAPLFRSSPLRGTSAVGAPTARISATPEMDGDKQSMLLNNPPLHVQKQEYPEAPQTVAKRKQKRSIGTCTTTSVTATAAAETTIDSADSVDTQDTTTNFRFTSFPASLPRIQQQHQKSTNVSSGVPFTVRKRMSFGVNRNNPDDSINSSMSSLQKDEQDCHEENDYDDEFGYNDDYDDEDNDDEITTNSSVHEIPKARLNFNAVIHSPLIPHSNATTSVAIPPPATTIKERVHSSLDLETDDCGVDLSKPYDHQHGSSFASSVSSIAKNHSGCCDDIQTTSTAGMTPSRTSTSHPTAAQSLATAPETPSEVQLHFQLDTAGCSPIPGIPEEEGDVSSKSSMFAAKKPLATSRDASTTDNSSGRPLPDLDAFDEANTSQLSVSSRSMNESSFRAPLSPRLLCPPTPVRTPAWANSDSYLAFKPGQKFARSNSLIATKVLATCSPQVLDERASLEGSLLEEGKSETSIDADPGENHISTALNPMTAITNNGVDLLQQSHRLTVQTISDAADGPKSQIEQVVTLSSSFDIISMLGRGTFADVYKVRSKANGKFYAVKRNRRQFRGRRDREATLAEVRSMQRLQSHVSSAHSKENNEKAKNSLYLLFFFQAWQEDGHFLCQMELCCRDTCREMLDSLRSRWNVCKVRYPSLQTLKGPAGAAGNVYDFVQGKYLPEEVIWKVCHDISAGLMHIHSHELVHNDIKPSNIMFVKHGRFGAICKIGDFGMARIIGSLEDGQEGDQKYMAPELLDSVLSHPTADIFSLGLTLYEMASSLSFTIPSEGPRWRELRSGQHKLDVPSFRSASLQELIRQAINPSSDKRPLVEQILSRRESLEAGRTFNKFLNDYINDVETFERQEEEALGVFEDQTPRNIATRSLCSPPPPGLPAPPLMMSSP